MEKKEKGERSVEISLPQPVRQALLSLKGAGFSAWLVGGCVRDALRGAAPHDWDLATDAAPEQVLAVFRDRRVIGTGLRHGTVTVLLEDTGAGGACAALLAGKIFRRLTETNP